MVLSSRLNEIIYSVTKKHRDYIEVGGTRYTVYPELVGLTIEQIEAFVAEHPDVVQRAPFAISKIAGLVINRNIDYEFAVNQAVHVHRRQSVIRNVVKGVATAGLGAMLGAGLASVSADPGSGRVIAAPVQQASVQASAPTIRPEFLLIGGVVVLVVVLLSR